FGTPSSVVINTAGAALSTFSKNVLLTPPGVCMTRATLPDARNGTSALTWSEDTNSKCAGVPFTVRQLSPIMVGSGTSLLAWLMLLRLVPRTLIRPPGATGDFRSAALTAPVIEGGATAASKLGGRMVIPEVVRATISRLAGRIVRVRVNAALVEPSSGASTRLVGVKPVPSPEFTRSSTPGLAESGAEIKRPFWSTKTNPEESPEVG